MTTSKAHENQPDNNDIHKVVKAEKFILVDPQGNERIAMRTSAAGRAVFTMRDSAGHLRLNLVVTDDESTLNIFSREEPFHGEPDHDNDVQRVRLGCLPASPEYIEMFKANYHNPELRLFDGEGNERVLLESYASGDGHLGYFRGDGANLLALQKDGLLVWDEESGEQIYYTLKGRKAKPLTLAGNQPPEEPEPSTARYQPIADALAVVLGHPDTPVELYNLLVDHLNDMRDTTRVFDRMDPDHFREWFPLACLKLSKKQQEG